MLLGGVAGARILHVLADGYFWDYVHLCTNPAASTGRSRRRSASRRPRATTACGTRPRASATRETSRLLRVGEVLGRRPHVLRRLHRRDRGRGAAAQARPIPVLEGGRHGRLRDRARPRVRSHGVPARRLLLRRGGELPWAMSFPAGSPASEAQHDVAPAREQVSGLAAGAPDPGLRVRRVPRDRAICWLYVHPRKRYDGQVFVWFLGLYAIARFLLEILRRDARGGVFGLSTSQLIGVALVAAAYGIHRLRKSSGELPSAAAVESAAA